MIGTNLYTLVPYDVLDHAENKDLIVETPTSDVPAERKFKMQLKNKKTRRIIARTLKKHSRVFEEYDRENNLFPVNLSDIDYLLKDIKDVKKEANDEIKLRFDEEIPLASLGVLLTGYFSLSIQQMDSFDECLDTEITPKPTYVIGNLLVQISNHALAIINLVENGLDNSGRVILRTIDELVYLTIYLCSDLNLIKVYSDLSNPNEVWYRHFRTEKINKAISNIEETFGFPDEFIAEQKKRRNDFFKFYSEYTHSSFGATMVGSYSGSFDDDETIYPNLFGRASKASIGTLRNLCDLLFYFNLAIFNLLSSKYQVKTSVSNQLWRITTSLLECYKTVYLEYKERNCT
ncbi:DUF5677 domain-containing protein [Paenibacillus sp. FSL R5-0470]|uniref:DUF5677 domain-containing protein n=1 Tax=Paenibacillus sp. FSL R5-0470 TaxID=2921641 RepID=UPI0030DBEF44